MQGFEIAFQVGGPAIAGRGTRDGSSANICIRPRRAPLDGARVAVSQKRTRRAEIVRCSATGQSVAPQVAVAGGDDSLPPHPKLRRGMLPNGLEYVILPNETPGERFEAHLEVFAGSTVEDKDQQGIAHVVEHVAYMGSSKRERLLSSTGASTNAHTDFHHTVFFASCPTRIPRSGESVLPMALDALVDVMEAKIEPRRVEKERAAILSEMLMVNTIDYRVECQLLASLHAENIVPSRFPIGLEEQIRAWTRDDVKRFHEEHYRPNNAVLYVAGDFDSADEVEKEIEHKFSHLKNRPVARDVAKGTLKATRSRHFPAITHEWSTQQTPLTKPTDVRVFAHDLLSSFSFHIYSKSPLEKVTDRESFRRSVLRKLGYTALQIRLNMAGRSEALSGESPFSTVEFLDLDSPREACEVRSLDLTAKPSLWRTAVRVAVREMRRFARYGLSAGEFERLRVTLWTMSQQSILEGDMTPTSDQIEDLMEALAAGHTFLTAEDYFGVLEEEVGEIKLEEINAFIAEMCAHSLWFEPSSQAPAPNAIVACAPANVSDLNEESLLEALMEAGKEEVFPEKDIEVPKDLMRDEDLLTLAKDSSAAWKQMKVNAGKTFALGELTNGVLANIFKSPKKSGRCCLRVTCPGGRSIESDAGDKTALGPRAGSVALGAATLQEGGAMGRWSREQVELFCIDNLIGVYVQAEEGAVYVDFVFPSETLPSVLQILRGMMVDFRWEEDALARGKEALQQRHREMESSLEEYSRGVLVNAMTGSDARLATPLPDVIESLDLDSASKAMDAHLATNGVELSIVGDFDMKQLAEMLRVYIGSIPSRQSSILDTMPRAVTIGRTGQAVRVDLPDTDERAVVYVAGEMPSGWGYYSDGTHVTLPKGSLGLRSSRETLLRNTEARRQHPLFAYVTFGILREVLSRRMFTELREEANLSYEANFKIFSFDNVHGGYYIATATAAPENAQRVLEVLKETLTSMGEGRSRITRTNVENARRFVLGRFEGSMENDGYIAQLMNGMQLSTNPLKTEHFLDDLGPVTDSITLDDVEYLLGTLALKESEMYSCIGLSTGEDSGDGQNVPMSARIMPRGGSTVLRH